MAFVPNAEMTSSLTRASAMRLFQSYPGLQTRGDPWLVSCPWAAHFTTHMWLYGPVLQSQQPACSRRRPKQARQKAFSSYKPCPAQPTRAQARDTLVPWIRRAPRAEETANVMTRSHRPGSHRTRPGAPGPAATPTDRARRAQSHSGPRGARSRPRLAGGAPCGPIPTRQCTVVSG